MSETDEQFVERMVNEWGEWAGSPANARLFALARRGAAGDARIKELEGDLQIAKLQLAAKRFT